MEGPRDIELSGQDGEPLYRATRATEPSDVDPVATSLGTDPGRELLYPRKLADGGKRRGKRGANRARRQRACVQTCIGISMFMLVASVAIPTVVFVLAHTKLVAAVARVAIPSLRIGDVAIGGLMTASATDLVYAIPGSNWCVTADSVAVSVSPTSVFLWAFGGAPQRLVVYNIAVEGIELGTGVLCNATAVIPEIDPDMFGGSWRLDWAAIVAELSRTGASRLRAAPGALGAITTALGALADAVCATSIDVARFSANMEDSAVTLHASAVSTRGRGAAAVAFIALQHPVNATAGIAYRVSSDCTLHEVAIRVASGSIGGFAGSLTCSASEDDGVSCTVAAAASMWGTADPWLNASFAAAPLDTAGWLATATVAAGCSSPVAATTSANIFAASACSEGGACGVILTRSDMCAAVLTPGTNSSDAFAGVWSDASGATLAAWEAADPPYLELRTPLRDRVVIVPAPLPPEVPHATSIGPWLSMNLTGSPDWALDVTSASWSFHASAAARSLTLSGTLPLFPYDPSGNCRVTWTGLRVWTEDWQVGVTCDVVGVDGEDATSIAAWARGCSGAMIDGNETALELSCDAASILGSAMFYSPAIWAGLLSNSTGANIRVSGGDIVLNSGIRVHFVGFLELALLK